MKRPAPKRKNKKASHVGQVLSYTVLLRPEPEGGYTVLVPSLPGCITYGKTIAHAQEMAGEAIGLYVDWLKESREVVPREEGSLLSSITVQA